MSHLKCEMSVWGAHPVEEALNSSAVQLRELILAENAQEKYAAVISKAKGKNVRIRTIRKELLSKEIQNEKHQNIAAKISLTLWESLSDWFEIRERSDPLLAVAVDGIQDPQNVGTLMRSAHFFGAEVFLMTRDRNSPLTGVVAKASSGALFSLPIVYAVNLARELEKCEELDIWRVGLEAKAEKNLEALQLQDRHLLLVVGSEGEGLRDLTRKRSDFLAKLPGSGRRESLNAAVAGSIALYEISRHRYKI